MSDNKIPKTEPNPSTPVSTFEVREVVGIRRAFPGPISKLFFWFAVLYTAFILLVMAVRHTCLLTRMDVVTQFCVFFSLLFGFSQGKFVPKTDPLKVRIFPDRVELIIRLPHPFWTKPQKELIVLPYDMCHAIYFDSRRSTMVFRGDMISFIWSDAEKDKLRKIKPRLTRNCERFYFISEDDATRILEKLAVIKDYSLVNFTTSNT